MSDILETINTKVTPQSEKAKANQVMNNAGGAVFEVTPEVRIRRFLILGTQNATMYQSAKELTKDNASVVIDWAENRTKELVDLIVEISEAGRAPKQNQGVFALAAAAALGDNEGRAYALAALPKVARTGTTLFMFAKYVEQFRGWGRGLRKAIANWYESKPADQAAFQAVKYRQREGWTHRDLLRLAHPKGASSAHRSLYTYLTKGLIPNIGLEDSIPSIISGFLAAQSTTKVSDWLSLINEYGLSWEMLPDAAMNEPDVWRAMIDKGVPMGALIRQLPRLTNLGVIKGTHKQAILAQLSDQDHITKSRLHPMNILIAQRTYASGHGMRTHWTPDVNIVDALNDAFYKAFGNVVPAGKRTLNALDVSGSMDWGNIAGLPITPRVAAGAMSLITVATEPEVQSVAFSSQGWHVSGNHRYSAGISPLTISAKQRLDDVLKVIDAMPMGGTDCALPMIYAKEKELEIDTFMVSTDNETWAGAIHPFQALKEYRKASGINARLIVVGYTATNFSIADPSDAGMLDVVGLDSATPQLIADFSAGRL